MSEKFSIQLMLHSNAADEALEQFVTLQERCAISNVILTDTTGITAHSANYRTITLQNGAGSQTYYSWSTKTGDQGALAAGTAANMIDPGSATSNPEFEAGAAFKIRSAASGSGKSQQTSVTIECERLRKY